MERAPTQPHNAEREPEQQLRRCWNTAGRAHHPDSLTENPLL